MELTGAEIFVRCLAEQGVDYVFGYPGGAILPVYDPIIDSSIRHILVRHEQGAGHMASGYAHATGRIGVTFATSGPGATNLITPLADAYMDSVPIVAVTGQVPSRAIGTDAFQEVGIFGITRPCTKHNYLVKNVDDLARTLREAFFLARSGRPGPVLVDIPKDIARAMASYKLPKSVKMASYNPTYNPNMRQLQKVVKLVQEAKRPVIFAGGDSSRTSSMKPTA